MTTRLLALLFIHCLLVATARGDVVPLERAHAHNDYFHPRPLLDALDHGFCSIEVDILLVDGELLVGHGMLDVRRDRTIQNTYLDPLLERVRENGGRVYGPGTPTVQLLVDIKTNANRTWAVLEQILPDYAEMLTHYSDEGTTEGAVSIVLSGHRPIGRLRDQSERLAAIDGRLSDLRNPPDINFRPLLSDNWRNHFTWNGIGPMPEQERERLHDLVRRTNARGERLRFWAVPARVETSQEYYDSGIDLINTDRLGVLRDHLLEMMEREEGRGSDQ